MGLVIPFDRPRERTPRQFRATVTLAGGSVLLAAAMLMAFCIGAVPISVDTVFSVVLAKLGLISDEGIASRDLLVVWSIRLPRVIAGCAIGSCLALAGATMQGLFRNPLADPGLIGVSSGAALAAVTVIVLGGNVLAALEPWMRPFALPAAAMAGGLAATWIVYRLGTVGGQTMIATTLLAGIAINAIAQSGVGFLVFLSDEQQLRDLSFWTLGSVAGVTWSTLLPALAMMVVPLLVLPMLAGALNAMLLGEREAFHLGHVPERVKIQAIGLSAVAVGAAVSISGTIGFVGLVIPHIVRLLCGPDHRYVLPGSIIFGSALFLLADLLSRTVVLPAEMPVGVITALVGGPFFIWLLMRRRDWG